MPKVLTLLASADLARVSRFTGISVERLKNLGDSQPIFGDILRKLYRYFDIDIDEFYIKNVENHQNRKKHEGIIGEFFRLRRVSLGMTIAHVAKIIRVSETTIDRLERGVQLPGANSYTTQKLFLLYNFTEEEKEIMCMSIEGIRRLRRLKNAVTF